MPGTVKSEGVTRRRRFRAWTAAVIVAVVVALGIVAWRPALGYWHLCRGQADLDRHRAHSALKHFEKALEHSSKSSEIHLLAARAARRSGNFDVARRHLLECQSREPWPSDDSILEWAMLDAASGHLDRVEAYLRKKVESGHPLSGLIYEALIEGYLRVYRVFAALGALRDWLEKEPNHVVALSLRGRTWQRVHAYPKAVDDLRRVIETDPERDDDRYRLAECLIEVSLPHEAAEHLEYLRVRRPDDSAVSIRLAFAWNQLGRGDDAIAVLDAILRHERDNATAYTAHAQIDFQAGRIESAERFSRKAIALNSHDRQAHFTLYQALASQPGREAESRTQQARLKEVEDRLERTIAIINRFMPQRPRDPDLQWELATLLLAQGQKELALIWFQSALTIDPEHAPSHRSLAEYYAASGDEEKATFHRRRAQASPKQ